MFALNSPDSLPQHLDDLAEFRRHGVTDGIGNVHGSRARVDHGLYYLHQKIAIRPGGIFGRKFHIVAERLGQTHALARLFQALFPRDAQFVLEMDIRGGEEYMDARACGPFQSLPGALDIEGAGACQPGNNRPAHGRCNRLYGLKISVGGDRESRFNHVHTQPVELMRHAQLLVNIHAATRGLLTVTQRGVENRDPYSFHVPGSSSRELLS